MRRALARGASERHGAARLSERHARACARDRAARALEAVRGRFELISSRCSSQSRRWPQAAPGNRGETMNRIEIARAGRVARALQAAALAAALCAAAAPVSAQRFGGARAAQAPTAPAAPDTEWPVY